MDKQRLNELLAEHVMGWRRWDTWADQARTRPKVAWFRPDRQYPTGTPDYLTREGMGMVVAKMKEKGWDFNLAQVGPIFTATFSRTLGPTMSEAFTHADHEAPVASGIAALRACGVEEVK